MFGHTATNLFHNLKEGLQGFSVGGIAPWHSIGSEEVENTNSSWVTAYEGSNTRNTSSVDTWAHEGNPDDLGSRGSDVNQT